MIKQLQDFRSLFADHVEFFDKIPKKYHKKGANSILMQTKRWKLQESSALEAVFDDGLQYVEENAGTFNKLSDNVQITN